MKRQVPCRICGLSFCSHREDCLLLVPSDLTVLKQTMKSIALGFPCLQKMIFLFLSKLFVWLIAQMRCCNKSSL